MDKINKYVKKIPFIILSLSFIIIRFPPVYVLPIRSSLASSHSIAKYLIIFLLIWLIISAKDKLIQSKRKNILIVLVLIYFISQSISVFYALNISEFLLNYKNIVFALLYFYCCINIIHKKSDIINLAIVFIFTGILDFILEFLIYFQPSNIIGILRTFAYDPYWSMFEMNFLRNRFFTEFIDAPLIPLLMYFSYKNPKKIFKLFSWLFIGIIALFALLSNFRINIIMVFFSFIAGLFIFKVRFNNLLFKIFLLIVFLFFGFQLSIRYIGYNSLDRLIFPGEDDYTAIYTRQYFGIQSLNMFLSSPMTGVGLGNYYDNLPSSDKISQSIFQWQNNLKIISFNHPHNIFFATIAETGIMGLVTFVSLIIYFFISDCYMIKSQVSKLYKSFILSFWCLFIYSLLNPSNTFSYLSQFWFLRGIIYSSNKINGKHI